MSEEGSQVKCFIFYIKKIPFFSLLGLTLVVTACSQLTAPNSFSTPSHQNTDYATFTYENVDFKIVSVAQQSSFDDDSTTGAAFIVRIGVKESNEADTGVYIPYSNAFL